MALAGKSKLSTFLLIGSLVLVIVGTALMLHASYDDAFMEMTNPSDGSAMTRESVRYNTAYFYFMWLSAFVTTSFQRPMLMAITAGFLSAILVFSFSLDLLDEVRSLLQSEEVVVRIPGYPTFGMPLPDDELKVLKQLAGGCILGYVGSGLAFIASVIPFRGTEVLRGPRLLFAGVILLFGVIGCALLWNSKDASSVFGWHPSYLRSSLFDATEGTVSVLIIYLVGHFFSVQPLLYIAGFLAAFYNMSSLDSFLKMSDSLVEERQTRAGFVFVWLSALFLILQCSLLPHSDEAYGIIGSDSTV